MYTFGFRDALVGARTGVGTYDTAVDVPAVQMMSAGIRVVSAEGFGDDELKVVATRSIAGTAQVRMLGVSLAALSVVLGVELVETGAAETLVRTLGIDGGHRFPSFGIVGQALTEEDEDGNGGGGDELLFMPNAKVTSDVTLGTFEYGAFQTVEFTITAVRDGTYKIINVIERATTAELALPPTGILEV